MCYQREHLIATSFAVFCIFFYVCGIPAISLFVLWKNKKNLDNEKIKATYGSLYQAYKPEYWYFECVEMLKKMALAGGLVLVRPGSSTQITIGLLITFAFFLMVLDWHPYEDKTDNRLQASAVSIYIYYQYIYMTTFIIYFFRCLTCVLFYIHNTSR